MRSRTGSSFAAILLFAPLMAVPLLAVFGVPEFTSVSASPSSDSFRDEPLLPIETRAGESLRYVPEDVFSPFSEQGAAAERPAPRSLGPGDFPDGVAETHVPVRPVRSPLRGLQEESDLPAEALAGWEFVDQSPLEPRGSRARPTEFADAGRSRPEPTIDLDAADFRNRATPRRPLEDHSPRRNVEPIQNEPRPIDRRETWPSSRREPATPDSLDMWPTAHTAPDAPADARRSPRTRPADPPERGTPAAATPLTWTSAVARLKAMGIRDFQLSPGNRADAFHFSCSYTPQDNPRITRRFEAEASEPLRAVEKVLAQIDEWQGQR